MELSTHQCTKHVSCAHTESERQKDREKLTPTVSTHMQGEKCTKHVPCTQRERDRQKDREKLTATVRTYNNTHCQRIVPVQNIKYQQRDGRQKRADA